VPRKSPFIIEVSEQEREVIVLMAAEGAVLRWADSGHAEAATVGRGSDRQGQPVERDRHPPAHWLLNREFVVAASDILHEGMPGDDHPGTAVLLASAHRSQPRLQPAVVALDSVVGVLLGAVPRRWQQLLDQHQVGRCSVGDDLHGRDLRRADRPLEEPAGRPRVPPHGDEHVDDLAELVDRSVHVPPPASHFDVGLVHEPAITNPVAAGTGGSASRHVNRCTHR